MLVSLKYIVERFENILHELELACEYEVSVFFWQVFDLLNKKKKLRVMEDHNQQVQVSKSFGPLPGWPTDPLVATGSGAHRDRGHQCGGRVASHSSRE